VPHEGPEEHLLRRARSPQDAQALVRFDSAMALPIVAAALLPLMLLPGSQHNVLAAVVNIVAWLVFVLDFVVHERKLTHYLSTWLGRFDLTVVILTAPWFLITGPTSAKFVLVVRLARVARIVMAGTGARRLFARIGRVAVLALAVVFIGAALAYRAEHPTNPGFATYGDALWWAIVTLTTVGYGDIVPKTSAGRITGVIIMVTGVGILGVLAGSLASFFHINSPNADDPSPPAEPEIDLRNEVTQLRDQIGRLTDQVSRLVTQQSPSDAPPEDD
jgi:voltage-gated potassium channel